MKTSTFVLLVTLFTIVSIITASKYNFGTRNDTFCVNVGNNDDRSTIKYCVPVREDDTPLRSYLDNVAKNIAINNVREGRKLVRALINGAGDDFECEDGWFSSDC